MFINKNSEIYYSHQHISDSSREVQSVNENELFVSEKLFTALPTISGTVSPDISKLVTSV